MFYQLSEFNSVSKTTPFSSEINKKKKKRRKREEKKKTRKKKKRRHIDVHRVLSIKPDPK